MIRRGPSGLATFFGLEDLAFRFAKAGSAATRMPSAGARAKAANMKVAPIRFLIDLQEESLNGTVLLHATDITD